MKRKFLAGLVGLIVAGGGWFLYQIFAPVPPIAVSKQTTWLTEPLADDGLPDYAKWLLDQEREGVTPENNAAIPLLRALWTEKLFELHAGLVCREIGMEVPNPNDDFLVLDNWTEPQGMGYQLWQYFLKEEGVEAASAQASYEQYTKWLERVDCEAATDSEESFQRAIGYAQQPWDSALSMPWTRDQFPPLAKWVDRHEKSFALLHEAAQKEKYYCPSPTLLTTPKCSLVEVLLTDIQGSRSAARLLAVRAMMHLGEKDAAAAWRDVQAIHRIADHLPEQTVVEILVRIAVHGIANSVSQQILASPHLDAATAKAMHSFYCDEYHDYDLTKSFDGAERLLMITSVLSMSGKREGADLTDLNLGQSATSIDWNIVLREMNVWYDRLVEMSKAEDFGKREAATTQFNADLNEMTSNVTSVSSVVSALLSRKSRSRKISEIMAALLLPALDAVFYATDRSLAHRQLMKVASALGVYRCENGTYPDSLDALVPELLPQLPKDAFTQAALVYTKTDEGYLLVNVGANGINEGGTHSNLALYKGVRLDSSNNEMVNAMKFLGEPIPRDQNGEIDWLKVPEIPETADDYALRIPQPPAKWPTGPAKK